MEFSKHPCDISQTPPPHTHTYHTHAGAPDVTGIFNFSLFKFRMYIATKQVKDDTVGIQAVPPWGQMGHWAFVFHGQMCSPRGMENRPLSGCREGYTRVPLASARVSRAHSADSSRAQAETPPWNPPN